MNQADKIELSKAVAEAYNVNAFASISKYIGNAQFVDDELWLLDDTARMFELLQLNSYNINSTKEYCQVVIFTKAESDRIVEVEKTNDHATKLEAALIAIAKALIKSGK